MNSERIPRSQEWFGLGGKNGFLHRSWFRNQGADDDLFDGRPVVGICNSWSELVPCNAHLRRVAERVKNGVRNAGGYPLEFPTMSLGETIMRPTTMLYRNLMSMDVEESLRSNPLDAVVLLGGCDKTVPAQVMGASSVDLPTIVVTGGPMLNGKFMGQDIGSGTDVWRYSEEVRAGRMSKTEFRSLESCMARSDGHCMTMGTASTMACIMEAMGLQIPGSAAVPAADAERYRLAEDAGRQCVTIANSELTPSRILNRKSLENAVRVNAAIGGSTNVILHLLAIAGRVGAEFSLDDFDKWSKDTPLLVNLRPSGKYLMEEFYYAGGLPAVIRELLPKLHGDCLTVNGRSLAENYSASECWDREVIYPLSEPLAPSGHGTAVLYGNLAPDGAVIKQSAASEALLEHTGPARVFESVEDYEVAADDPSLDVSWDTVLIVRNSGPQGYPGMPEIGNFAIPRKLLDQGITDMVRISDARMSGTAYGTIVLHVAPESAVGGPLALVKDGDLVTLDVAKRSLRLQVSEDELARRRSYWARPNEVADRGYVKMYIDNVMQANAGADLTFLQGASGSFVPRRPF